MPYEPKIVAFLCTWCSYTGADTAGIARLKSPANVRGIRVPCSGRVSPEIIMRTFDQGADGVLILACHIGECHYESGNHRTAKRVPILRSLMAFTGLEPERLRLDWVSASEGERFSRIVTEFTDTVRALGPVKWIQDGGYSSASTIPKHKYMPAFPAHPEQPVDTQPVQDPLAAFITTALQDKARELLSSGQVGCVIGYEKGTHGNTRPAFIYDPLEVDRLVWNDDCTHNLTTYLHYKLTPPSKQHKNDPAKPVAVVVKPCDSRAINVLLAEHRFEREQVHVLGIACTGIRQHGYTKDNSRQLQERCQECNQRLPVLYDTLLGEAPETQTSPIIASRITTIDEKSPLERMDYWLTQFDRCIRCYACRQACPMCDCPTCLYERDDSLWVGLGIGINEKRTFHLGRAYHLAGRCVNCHECERVCPMDIPISLLNGKLIQEMESVFAHRAGLEPLPSPFVTILNGEEQIP
jgi:coenzyme F420-reducing hydrogenase delta subunit/ferredoxin